MDYKKQAIDKGIQVMDDLTDLFNNYNSDGQEAFVNKFATEHRTLQQSVLGGLFKLMVQCADRYDKGHYDDRNHASLKACKDMVTAYEEKYGYKPSEAFPLV